MCYWFVKWITWYTKLGVAKRTDPPCIQNASWFFMARIVFWNVEEEWRQQWCGSEAATTVCGNNTTVASEAAWNRRWSERSRRCIQRRHYNGLCVVCVVWNNIAAMCFEWKPNFLSLKVAILGQLLPSQFFIFIFAG